jgi:phosphosulfolactate synthase (CoM biosynthesis protein A)
MEAERSLEERLGADHPELLSRFKQIADIVENSQGNIELADEAERRVIQEVRQLGKETLQSWGRQQETRISNRYSEQVEDVRRNGKKNSTGIAPLVPLK